MVLAFARVPPGSTALRNSADELDGERVRVALSTVCRDRGNDAEHDDEDADRDEHEDADDDDYEDAGHEARDEHCQLKIEGRRGVLPHERSAVAEHEVGDERGNEAEEN